jgi:hypothetical protein
VCTLFAYEIEIFVLFIFDFYFAGKLFFFFLLSSAGSPPVASEKHVTVAKDEERKSLIFFWVFPEKSLRKW